MANGRAHPSGKGELFLEIRTPSGRLFHGNVSTIRAEDLDGWFGIRPHRPDLIAALRPGLLIFEDEQGSAFVATSGGMLNLFANHCQVALQTGVLTRSPSELAAHLAKTRDDATARKNRRDEVSKALLAEAVRRVAD